MTTSPATFLGGIDGPWSGTQGNARVEPTVQDTDAALVERVLAGDASGFEELITRHQARIFATARRYARREDEVEDIVQEVFLKAYRKLASFRGDAPFEHWLMKLAVRTCYDFLRTHQRNREHTFSELAPEDDGWVQQVPGRDESQAEGDSRKAAERLVSEALEQLSPAARLVLTLLELEDKSVNEIAALTGWSATLVKVRAFRARAELRKVLERMSLRKYL